MLLLEKHWDKYVIELKTGCYVWIAATAGSRGKQPAVQHCGKYQNATRIVCEEANGTPTFLRAEAAHKCGNPLCMRGDHMYWATRSQNEFDKSPETRKRVSQMGVAANVRDESGRYTAG